MSTKNQARAIAKQGGTMSHYLRLSMVMANAKRYLVWLIIPLYLWLLLSLTGGLESIVNIKKMYNTPSSVRGPILEVAGKQIPIPDRVWTVARSGREAENLPGGPAVIEKRVLISITNKSVIAFVIINANTAPTLNGWGISKDCKNTKYPFTAVFEEQNGHYSCAFINELDTEVAATILPTNLMPEVQQKWHVPKKWLVVGIRLADRLDIVDIRYGFDPQVLVANEKFDLESADAGAFRQKVIKSLTKWQESASYLVERGFRRQLNNELPLPMPTLDTDQSTSPLVVSSRLKQLETLRDNGWLSRIEFEKQRALIKQSYLVKDDLTVNIWRLGAIKTAGHTVQTTLWMWGVNYLFLGNAYLAGGLALTKAAVSPVRYYLEESAWNTWGPRRNPTLPTVDFSSEIGH